MMHGSLPARLRVLRARQGLTLIDAAEKLGIGRDTLSDLERGNRHPVYPTLKKIAEGYGVPVEELLPEEEPVGAEKAEARQGREAEPPRRWEYSPYKVVGRVVDGELRMAVRWYVPEEEREQHRPKLHDRLPGGFIELGEEGEVPEWAPELAGTTS